MSRSREEKVYFREKYIEKRKRLDPENKLLMDKRICETFTKLVSYRHAKNILMYYPKASEIDIRPIMEKALADGKRVAFPRCDESDEPNMNFYFVTSDDDFESGKFGLMEPKTTCELFDKEKEIGPTVILVPALTFDTKGYRLGYGKGYYDRYIDKNKMSAVGVTYFDFIEKELPRGRFDISVHFLITEKGVQIVD